MNNKSKQVIFWAPRVLVMCYALFLSLFAMDVFSEDQSLHTTLLASAIHLIPTFLIFLMLLVAWHWEWIGTVTCIGLSIVYPLWTKGMFPVSTYLFMTGPLLLVGLLFMLGWIYNPRRQVTDSQKERKPLLWITLPMILLVIAGILLLPGTQKPPQQASILKPVNGSAVLHQVQAMGEFTEDLFETDLWLVVQSRGDALFHPQPGPIFKPPRRMQWYSTISIGQPDAEESGGQFTVYLFAATTESSEVFKAYLKHAEETQSWPGLTELPEGLTSLSTVQVVRK